MLWNNIFIFHMKREIKPHEYILHMIKYPFGIDSYKVFWYIFKTANMNVFNEANSIRKYLFATIHYKLYQKDNL